MESYQLRQLAKNEEELSRVLATLPFDEKEYLLEQVTRFLLREANVDASGRPIPQDSRARRNRYFNSRFNNRMQTGAYCGKGQR